MAQHPIGTQAVGTLTVGASGAADSVGYIVPALSNSPFKSLSITIRPLESTNISYEADVYFDGELVESHTFPANDRVICHLSYPNVIFPANVGENAIPAYYSADKASLPGLPIRVGVTNRSADRRTFLVYATYEICDPGNFIPITQE